MKKELTKEQKIVKFNMYTSCVLLVAFVLMLIGVTIAYFTDTKKMSNTFTAGNVKLALSEAAVKPDSSGNLVEDTSADRIYGGTEKVVNNYGKVYPKQSIFKDPTIANIGDTPEWAAVKVTFRDGVGDLTKIMGYEGYEDIDIEVLLSGGLLDEDVHVGTWNGIDYVCYNENYAMVQVPNPAEDKFDFYFFMLNPLGVDKSVVVFDHIKFPAEWNVTEMQEFIDFKIDVQAFAVQTFDLKSCFEAMTKAFPDHFNFN